MERIAQALLPLDEFHSRAARFFMAQHTKTGKMYQITIKYTTCPQNIPNSSKIDQKAIKYTNIIPLQDPPKFTQIWIFGSKIRHLATLFFKLRFGQVLDKFLNY
jgi:hypothetical protein